MAGRMAGALRFIADRLALPPLQDTVKRPGINAAYRVTISYPAGDHAEQVATLLIGHAAATLSVLYHRAPDHPRLSFDIPRLRERKLTQAFIACKFDRLDDQPGLAPDRSLWLVERASATHYHDVVLAPGKAEGGYRCVVMALRAYLPEALRPAEI